MSNSTKNKPVYFNTENFVAMVLKEMRMDKAPEHVLKELSLEIAQTMNDRVTATVVAVLGDKELFLMEKMLKDHPELDEIDALSIITSYIPGLDDLILKAVGDLFEELVENARMINQSLQK